MKLGSKLTNPDEPLVFYEVIPPSVGGVDGVGPGVELEARLELIRDVAGQVDAINIPEIRQEVRRGARKLRERMEPRAFAKAIGSVSSVSTVLNRVTVHEDAATHRQWLREAHQHGAHHIILVGGESAASVYPGPSVLEAAALAVEEDLPLQLGGITIAHRAGEAERVRAKHARGLRFFTTQVLLGSRDVIHLIRALDDLPVRILLSFTPVSHVKDLDFLEWLGVPVPAELRKMVLEAASADEMVAKSIALARQVLIEVCDSRGPRSPAVGLQVERITKRNSAAARLMLTELAGFYTSLLQSRARGPAEAPAPLAARHGLPRQTTPRLSRRPEPSQ